MKMVRTLVSACVIACSTTCLAETAFSSGGDGGSDLKTLIERITNLGNYFGYDITTEPKPGSDKGAQQQLFDIKATKDLSSLLIKAVLSAQPVDAAMSQAFMMFVPSGTPAESINAYANTTYQSNNSGGDASQNGIPSTSPLIDQKPYQPDPVSQALLNIVGTPEFNYCKNAEGGIRNDCLFATKVFSNIVGEVPDPIAFGNYKDKPPAFLAQLNVNALLGPMLFSSQGTSTSNTGGTNNGLSSNSQQDNALNFIRYATGTVSPIELPSLEKYNRVYQGLFATDPATKLKSKEKLAEYLTHLRVYTAQASVGISNLYYIFGKRVLPIAGANTGADQQPQSQSLMEFNMATRRLFTADEKANKDKPNWMDQLNNATPAQVQKEIAVLLAEINYQMYLNRQQDERMLMTESMMLLINTHQNVPDASLGTDSGGQ